MKVGFKEGVVFGIVFNDWFVMIRLISRIMWLGERGGVDVVIWVIGI